jgi:hypothetical protein
VKPDSPTRLLVLLSRSVEGVCNGLIDVYLIRLLSLVFAAMCQAGPAVIYSRRYNGMEAALAQSPRRPVLRYARPLGYLLRLPELYSTTAPVCVRCLW